MPRPPRSMRRRRTKTLALVNELKKLNLPEPEKDNILFMEASADESKGLLKEAP